MEWIEAKLYTTHEGIEPVTAMLINIGVSGMQIEDDEDLSQFLKTNAYAWDYVDEQLLDRQGFETCITFYVSDNAFGHELVLSVKDGISRLRTFDTSIDLGRLALELQSVDDETWLNEWKKYYKPLSIGERIVIKPVWEQYEPKRREIVVNINPGNLFGTGLHQTTQLCITMLEKYIKPGSRLLDLGCGSGILSITALLLPARSALAVDMDPNAIAVVDENAALNFIEKDRLVVLSGNLLSDSALLEVIKQNTYDVVAANIVADVIIAVSAFVAGCLKKDGTFIASGIIDERLDDVTAALADSGFTILQTVKQDGWVCVVSALS